MIKFSLLLLTAYVLYYAGNIIYDLFLKKAATTNQEESEVFSLSDFSETEDAKNIGIEDVENLNTPQSFTKKEIIPKLSSEHEERLSLDELRQRFESEQDLDHISDNEPEKKKEAPKEKDSSWQNILNLSETMVQLVSNIDGHKVYQSTM